MKSVAIRRDGRVGAGRGRGDVTAWQRQRLPQRLCAAELKLQQAQRRVQTNAAGAGPRPCGLQKVREKKKTEAKLKREKLKKTKKKWKTGKCK